MAQFAGIGTKEGSGIKNLRDAGRQSRQYMEAGGPGSMGVNAESFQIGDQWTSQFDQMAQQAANRQIGAGIAGQQQTLADLLYQGAIGQGPSAAQALMQRGMDQAIAGQRAMAASGPASTAAFAQRQAAQNIGGIQQGVAGQMAALRAQEQQQAQGQLGQVLGGMRGQDIQSQAINDALMQNLMAQGYSRDQAQQMAFAQMEQMRANNWQSNLSASVALQTGEQQAQMQQQGAATQAVSAGLGII